MNEPEAERERVGYAPSESRPISTADVVTYLLLCHRPVRLVAKGLAITAFTGAALAGLKTQSGCGLTTLSACAAPLRPSDDLLLLLFAVGVLFIARYERIAAWLADREDRRDQG